MHSTSESQFFSIMNESTMENHRITDFLLCAFADKTRFPDGEPGDGDIGGCPVESDAAGPSSAVRPLQSDDPGIFSLS